MFVWGSHLINHNVLKVILSIQHLKFLGKQNGALRFFYLGPLLVHHWFVGRTSHVCACFLHRFQLWCCCRYHKLRNHWTRWFMWGLMRCDVVVVFVDSVDVTRVWGDGYVYDILLLSYAFLQWWVACLIWEWPSYGHISSFFPLITCLGKNGIENISSINPSSHSKAI